MKNNQTGAPTIVNLYPLKVFLEVTERLSFSKAAHGLSLSQPAVSGHVRRLEQACGVPLFDQRKHNLSLTEAGLQLREYADRIISVVGEAETAVAGVRELGGRAYVAYSEHMRPLLPDVLFDFQFAHPRTRLVLSVGSTDRVMQLLYENRVGIGFVHGKIKDPEFEAVYVNADDTEPVLIAPLGHPVSELDVAKPQVLMQYPFVHYRSQSLFWSKYLKGIGVKPNYVLELDHLRGIELAVERGLGISLVDGSTVTRGGNFAIVPFAGPMLSGPVYAMRNKRRYFSAVERALLEHVLAKSEGLGTAASRSSAGTVPLRAV